MKDISFPLSSPFTNIVGLVSQSYTRVGMPGRGLDKNEEIGVLLMGGDRVRSKLVTGERNVGAFSPVENHGVSGLVMVGVRKGERVRGRLWEGRW
jgi:hypothetical protein